MVKKIIGPLIVFLCLCWIVFVVSEILQKKKENNFLYEEIENLKKLYDEYYTLKLEYTSKLYKMTPKDENILKIEMNKQLMQGITFGLLSI